MLFYGCGKHEALKPSWEQFDCPECVSGLKKAEPLTLSMVDQLIEECIFQDTEKVLRHARVYSMGPAHTMTLTLPPPSGSFIRAVEDEMYAALCEIQRNENRRLWNEANEGSWELAGRRGGKTRLVRRAIARFNKHQEDTTRMDKERSIDIDVNGTLVRMTKSQLLETQRLVTKSLADITLLEKAEEAARCFAAAKEAERKTRELLLTPGVRVSFQGHYPAGVGRTYGVTCSADAKAKYCSEYWLFPADTVVAYFLGESHLGSIRIGEYDIRPEVN